MYNGFMTKERRIVFDVSDITAVRIKCLRCKHENLIDIEERKTYSVPNNCPHCNEPWNHSYLAEADLTRALYGVRAAPSSKMSLRLEMKDDVDDLD